MPLPRARFTVRRMMVAVAVSGVASVWWAKQGERRRAEFLDASANHALFSVGRGDYHDRMSAKYERAADFPWLPVWPDPPHPCPRHRW
jgi:hypothetical protein